MAAELIFGLIPADLLLVIVMIGFPALLLFFFVLMDARSAHKAKVLVLESEKQGYFCDKKVRQGVITFGKKTVHIDEDSPLLVPDGFIVKSFRPLHVIKHDKSLPLKFTEKGLKVISSENLKNFMENKTLAQLLTPKDANRMAIVLFILGAIIGGLFGYVLSTLH